MADRSDPSHPAGRAARDVAVRAYAAHLLDGGSATWTEWCDESSHPATNPVSGPLPGPAQLEVARRLTLLRPGRSRGLVELALRTPAPGRGRVDAPLPWPGLESRPGPPAVDPDRLPPEELLRVCLGVLSTLCARLASAPPPRRPRRDRRRRLPGRRRPIVIDGGPLEAMMAGHWAARVAAGETLGWERLWRGAHARGRLPREVDVTRRAAAAVARSGAVTVRMSPELPAGAANDRPDLVGVDLWRRLNQVLVHRAVPPQDVRRVLPPLLRVDTTAVSDLATPRPQRRWARAQARALADRLRTAQAAADYAVLGDVDIVAREVDAPERIAPEQTLALALRACDRAWQEVER